MVRLTRLKIDRFRNVKPGTDLHFGPTFNVLLGKNATGKTTLLDLIATVTNDDLSAYAKEEAGFDLTWWIEEGENQLEVRAVRTPATPNALLESVRENQFDDTRVMTIRMDGAETIRIEFTGTHGTYRSDGGSDLPVEVRGDLAGSFVGIVLLSAVALENRKGTALPRWFMQIASMYGSGGWVGRLDEALSAVHMITRSDFELSRKGDEKTASSGTWVPRDLLPVIDAPDRKDPLVVSFSELESLRDVPALLGFVSAELRPPMLKRSQEGDKVTTRYQGFGCVFRRANGSQISHELLSFGQKRLFAFLWYLAVRRELPVVADELLNGLHHDWIEICLDRLHERQSFLATQHPYLLDHIPIESAAGVQNTFIRCTLETGPEGREQMVWRNFTEDEAELFYVAHQTGIQHVSEILRSEGLW